MKDSEAPQGSKQEYEAAKCKTETQQDSDMTTDMTQTEANTTEERERERGTSSGQPPDVADNPTKQQWRGESENKGKTHAKHSNKACNSKTNKRKTLEREEMD